MRFTTPPGITDDQLRPGVEEQGRGFFQHQHKTKVSNMTDCKPLHCGIYRDGEIVAVTDLPDPRAAFCAQWNGMATDSEARPLSETEAEDARRELASR